MPYSLTNRVAGKPLTRRTKRWTFTPFPVIVTSVGQATWSLRFQSLGRLSVIRLRWTLSSGRNGRMLAMCGLHSLLRIRLHPMVPRHFLTCIISRTETRVSLPTRWRLRQRMLSRRRRMPSMLQLFSININRITRISSQVCSNFLGSVSMQ
ncbi:MAG: Uncharacterised protein [Methanobacteriota archaeon]|nr:MAG: Uncharacterised protein [Euryarchaeota archaeon]